MNPKIKELQRKIDNAISQKKRMMTLSLLEELRVEQDKEEKEHVFWIRSQQSKWIRKLSVFETKRVGYIHSPLLSFVEITLSFPSYTENGQRRRQRKRRGRCKLEGRQPLARCCG